MDSKNNDEGGGFGKGVKCVAFKLIMKSSNLGHNFMGCANIGHQRVAIYLLDFVNENA